LGETDVDIDNSNMLLATKELQEWLKKINIIKKKEPNWGSDVYIKIRIQQIIRIG